MTPSGPTILIVDDDQLHLTLYTWILQRQGYKCETALVKSTSVDLPQITVVDLVLLDYSLNSSLTSLDVAHKIKKVFPAAPIVILSEMQWMPDEMKDHAVAFINKGDPKRLVDIVSDVLQGNSPQPQP
jgi:DNA-binding NtrC family response regulator